MYVHESSDILCDTHRVLLLQLHSKIPIDYSSITHTQHHHPLASTVSAGTVSTRLSIPSRIRSPEYAESGRPVPPPSTIVHKSRNQIERIRDASVLVRDVLDFLGTVAAVSVWLYVCMCVCVRCVYYMCSRLCLGLHVCVPDYVYCWKHTSMRMSIAETCLDTWLKLWTLIYSAGHHHWWTRSNGSRLYRPERGVSVSSQLSWVSQIDLYFCEWGVCFCCGRWMDERLIVVSLSVCVCVHSLNHALNCSLGHSFKR